MKASRESVMIGPRASLQIVRVVHTIAWAFFAGCILAIPVSAWRGEFKTAGVLIVVVFGEVIVILANHWRCPLTGVAARYTDERQDNFDIYLPLWLARYNKQIFGTLFVAGLLFTWARWEGWI